MNTYIQDELIPIYIFLQYDGSLLKFPINPEELSKDIPSDSYTAEVEGVGQVSVPTTPKLAKIKITSFFWHKVNLIPSGVYVKWLEKWQKSKKPARLIVTRLNYNMQVTCESFVHTIKAGEEKDVYFELDLQEYRPYGAKALNPISRLTSTFRKVMDTIKNVADVATSVLVEIPRPSRDLINKTLVTSPYRVNRNETLMSITKRITGSTADWIKLYRQNISLFNDQAKKSDSVPVGTMIELPEEWTHNSAYGITTVSGDSV